MQVYECIFSLITGVGVFILAMKIMSDSLKEIAGERMKTLLEKLASNRIAGVLIGALVTAIIQSSSATTVMVIGFVNADVMTLNQAAAIIIGSNIGTTATGLLASLESLNISLYLSMLVFIGVMLSFIKKLKKVANLLVGLGMIFVGLKLMSNACNDDSIKDSFADVLQKINFPLLLELLGIIFTAIIQSSSAMTGIVIVMVGNKVMGMDNGLFITLGANVGTCVTALIGIIGANINSKRTAVIHLIFNICGCLLFTPILWIFNDQILDILNSIVKNNSMQIAYFHLFFNIVTAIITMPLIDCLVKIAKKVVADEKPDRLIVEVVEEKNSFKIRRDTSISEINTDGINNTSNYINEKSISDNSYIKDNNKYEPPNIILDYFDENRKEEEKDEEKDDEINSNDVELIEVKEKEKNLNKNNIKEEIKNSKNNEKNQNKININGEKIEKIEEIEKKEENEKIDYIPDNKNENNNQNKNDDDDNDNIKENEGIMRDKLEDKENKDNKENNLDENEKEDEKLQEEKDNNENKEKENEENVDIENKELRIDKKKNKVEEIVDNEIKNRLDDKIDKKYEEEKDCEKINVNIKNDEN